MKRMVYPVFLILLVSQLGCGEKISDVLKKYEDDFQKKRDQFRSIANSSSEGKPPGALYELQPAAAIQ